MRLGTIDMLREALGGKTSEGELAVGRTYAVALKKAAGAGGTRLFDVDLCVKFRREHPDWKMTEVYPRLRRPQPARSRKGRSAESADKCGASS